MVVKKSIKVNNNNNDIRNSWKKTVLRSEMNCLMGASLSVSIKMQEKQQEILENSFKVTVMACLMGRKVTSVIKRKTTAGPLGESL